MSNFEPSMDIYDAIEKVEKYVSEFESPYGDETYPDYDEIEAIKICLEAAKEKAEQ